MTWPIYLNYLQQNLHSSPYPNNLRSQGYPEGGFEGGIDIAAPGGTPIYALETGTLQGAGYFCHGGGLQNATMGCSSGSPGYGVLTQRVNVPGYGMQDLYYQHIKLSPNIPICGSGKCSGYIVQKGQQIGTILPNVGMLEMGFNAGGQSSGPGGNGVTWGTIWGGSHPGSWVSDPRAMLATLANNFGGPTSSTGDFSATSIGNGSLSDLPLGIGNAVSALEQSFVNMAEEIGVFVLALLIILLGVLLLAGKQIEHAAKKAGEAAILA